MSSKLDDFFSGLFTPLWSISGLEVLLKYMEKKIRNFIWIGYVSSRKLVTVFWDLCCLTHREEGLGIKRLGMMNEAMLTKLAACIFKARDGVLRLLRSRYVKGINLSRTVTSFILDRFKISIYHSGGWPSS